MLLTDLSNALIFINLSLLLCPCNIHHTVKVMPDILYLNGAVITDVMMSDGNVRTRVGTFFKIPFCGILPSCHSLDAVPMK